MNSRTEIELRTQAAGSKDWPNFTVVDRTGPTPRILPQAEADAIAEKIAQPLTEAERARLAAYHKATDAYRSGRTIEEAVAAAPDIEPDELIAYLRCLDPRADSPGDK
jgi:hypothetical protein